MYGPDLLHGEDRREHVRDFAKALSGMPNLAVLHCDVSYCSLEVCVVLSTACFNELGSLALRITDHSIPISLSVYQLGNLQPHLPNLKRLIIRDNTKPSHAQHFIQQVMNSRRNALTELMLSCWYDSGSQYLQRIPYDAPRWSCLNTLTIRRDAFNLDDLSLIPQIQRLTLLRDQRPIPQIPSHILPNLQYVACATVNLAAFLPSENEDGGRPIRRVKLDGVSATGTYHGPRNQPTRSVLRNALRHLQFSTSPLEDLAFPIRMLYAEYFSDVAPYLSEAKSLVIHVVSRASVQTAERRKTQRMPMRELGQRIVRQLPRLQTLLMANAVVPCRNDEPVASEMEKIARHKAILEEWSTYRPNLTRVALGQEYLWEKGVDGWRRVDAIYEQDDHELRAGDY
ncbi:hypothetical protein BC835DRAFT_945820 [Cytidiella melzeri]|nr:hypothetical protein BC835DRAFT_945820 [Cytidiella melzeri]